MLVLIGGKAWRLPQPLDRLEAILGTYCVKQVSMMVKRTEAKINKDSQADQKGS